MFFFAYVSFLFFQNSFDLLKVRVEWFFTALTKLASARYQLHTAYCDAGVALFAQSALRSRAYRSVEYGTFWPTLRPTTSPIVTNYNCRLSNTRNYNTYHYIPSANLADRCMQLHLNHLKLNVWLLSSHVVCLLSVFCNVKTEASSIEVGNCLHF